MAHHAMLLKPTREPRTSENELALDQVTEDQYELFYTEAAIGTPPQHVNMIIDMGFSDIFWVVGTSFTAGCSSSLYNSSASSAAENQSAISYVYYPDGLALQGNHQFGEPSVQAKNTTRGLLSGPIAGLIGLDHHAVLVSGHCRWSACGLRAARVNKFLPTTGMWILDILLSVHGIVKRI
ncbi:hypothetical protein K438DRAFT_599625 [Mycena galopus ATCC 62051]|nr:hypothetical protein K438DRAFT_599625 [Mycena galopus ATCC 62051]